MSWPHTTIPPSRPLSQKLTQPQRKTSVTEFATFSFPGPQPHSRSCSRLIQAKTNADDIPVDQLRRLALHKNEQIDSLVHKRWGNIGPGTSEEKLATMRRFNNDLRAGTGKPAAGQVLFEKNCGVCHQLFGHGNKIGPDLTTANRSDRAALLGNIVDPSAVIRREFMNYVVVTTSGRVLTGVMAEQDGAVGHDRRCQQSAHENSAKRDR